MRFYLSFKKHCPKCKKEALTRVKRHRWMRYLPNSKYYECNFCRNNILVIEFFKKTVEELAEE